MKKILRGPRLGLNLAFLSVFQGCIISFFDIAQDFSLAQCLTSSAVGTSKKPFCGPSRDRNDLFYSKVVERPLKLACFFILLVKSHIVLQKLNQINCH